MDRENCPDCGHHVGTPGGYHGDPAMTMHSQRDCPNCRRTLIWFVDSDALAPGWRIDDDAERQRKRRQT
jgi:hypothetical protein